MGTHPFPCGRRGPGRRSGKTLPARRQRVILPREAAGSPAIRAPGGAVVRPRDPPGGAGTPRAARRSGRRAPRSTEGPRERAYPRPDPGPFPGDGAWASCGAGAWTAAPCRAFRPPERAGGGRPGRPRVPESERTRARTPARSRETMRGRHAVPGHGRRRRVGRSDPRSARAAPRIRFPGRQEARRSAPDPAPRPRRARSPAHRPGPPA